MDYNFVTMTPDGRVTRANAAAFLGLSGKTLAHWKMKGLGPQCVKVGGRAFYYMSDLLSYIEGGALS